MQLGLEVGNKLDTDLFKRGHREFYSMNELVQAISRTMTVWSWGAKGWTKMNDFCLRFKVNGRHHKGYVYLVVNGLDLFDAYLTNNRGRIVEVEKDIFLDDLVYTLDRKIEWIEGYK